jgi:2-polyprenyl-6-methoxyphenol hydroxylase-like FAD-dependent oxidoreductase
MGLVIVGAGPCGAALAVALSRAGLAVTLVEASAGSGRTFRGEALMPSGLEALERLGLLPLPQGVPQRALTGWRVAVNGRNLFALHEPLEGPAGQPCTLVSQQAWLEALLRPDHRPVGLTLLAGTAVADLLRGPSGRVEGVVLADGRQLMADLVVGCDGRGSLLRRRAGVALQGQERPIDVLWFRFSAAADPLPDGGFTTLVGPGGLASLFIGAEGRVHLGWAIAPGAATPQLNHEAWMEQLARQSPPDLASWLARNSSQLGEPVRFSVQVGMAERWWQPGLLLLGDAAHPMSPVRAQGINMALRDAAIAAETLLNPTAKLPLSGDALDGALAAIEAARRPEVELLQELQAEELQRGALLESQPWLRQLLAMAAPLVGSAVGTHWRRQQQQLRHGIASLAPRR